MSAPSTEYASGRRVRALCSMSTVPPPQSRWQVFATRPSWKTLMTRELLLGRSTHALRPAPRDGRRRCVNSRSVLIAVSRWVGLSSSRHGGALAEARPRQPPWRGRRGRRCRDPVATGAGAITAVAADVAETEGYGSHVPRRVEASPEPRSRSAEHGARDPESRPDGRRSEANQWPRSGRRRALGGLFWVWHGNGKPAAAEQSKRLALHFRLMLNPVWTTWIGGGGNVCGVRAPLTGAIILVQWSACPRVEPWGCEGRSRINGWLHPEAGSGAEAANLAASPSVGNRLRARVVSTTRATTLRRIPHGQWRTSSANTQCIRVPGCKHVLEDLTKQIEANGSKREHSPRIDVLIARTPL